MCIRDSNKDNLEYSQRSITNIILNGTHTIIDSSFLSKLVDKIEWKISPTISKIHDKDVRSTIFIDDNNAFKYKDNTQPTRIWRFLNENHLNSKIDFTKNYELDSEKAKLKYGALATFQSRNFQIARFQVSCWDDPSVWSVINGDPNLIFDPNVLVTASNPIGSYMNPRATITDRSSQFESTKRNLSGYISNELKLFGVLKTIVGLRMEKFDLFYTGQNSSGDNFNNQNVINKLDLFPTGNFIF